MKRFTLYLPEQLQKRIDAHRKKTGMKAAELVRRAVDWYLSCPQTTAVTWDLTPRKIKRKR